MLLNKTDKSELDGLGEILDELFSSGARWAWHETQAKNAKRASIDEPTLDPKRAKQAILDLLLGGLPKEKPYGKNTPDEYTEQWHDGFNAALADIKKYIRGL